MALKDNSPVSTWVSYTGVIVTHNGKSYPIKDDKTNKKYIFWDSKFPNQFKSTMIMPDSLGSQFLVAYNVNGVATTVPQNEVMIAWDGGLNMDLSGIQSSIGAMQDQITDLDGKTTTRFVGIETDIEGIKGRVSKVEEDSDLMKESVADVWVKADEIGTSVEEVKKHYDELDDDLTKFKEQTNQDLIDVGTGLGNFSDYVNNAFKDNVISESEALIIKEHLVTLDKEKKDVDKQVNYLLDSSTVVGDIRNKLVTAKNNFDSTHTNLTDIINTVIADGLIIPSERTMVSSAFAQYNFRLAELKSTIQEVTDLGVVDRIETAKSEVIQTATEITATVSKKVDELEGSVTEELSQIKQTSSSITSRVEVIEKNYSTEEAMQDAVNKAKEEILGQVTDMEGIIDMVEDYINNTFGDRLLNESYLEKLKDLIVNLGSEKVDIDNQVNIIDSSEFLSENIKRELVVARDDFNNAHTILLDTITIIVENGNIDNTEKRDVESKISKYLDTVVALRDVLNRAIDDISTNKMNKAIDLTEKEIEDLNTTIVNLGGYIEGAFSDGILDEIEKANLRTMLNSLDIEKADIDNQVSQIIINTNLSSSVKSELKLAKDNYNLVHEELVVYVENLLQLEEVMDSDLVLLNSIFGNYVIVLGEVKKHIQISIQDITEQSVNSAKQDLETQIGDVDLALGDLNDYLEEGFKNGILTEAEILTIKAQLNSLDTEKKDVDYRYSLLVDRKELGDFNTEFKNSKNNFDTAHANLLKIISDMISDNQLTNQERQQYELAMSVYGDTLKVLKGNLQKATELIPSYLIDKIKVEIEADVKDVADSVNSLEQEMNTSFKDGVITEAEKISLGEQVKTLETEAQDLLGRYESLVNNKDLIREEKDRLTGAFNEYNTAHAQLVNKIKTIISKTEITPEDRLEVETLLSTYRVKLKSLSVVFDRCIDMIAKKKVEDLGEVVDNKFSEIKQTVDEISLKVESVEQNMPNKEEIDKTMNDMRDEFNEGLSSMDDKIDNALENLEDIFADGIISETEAKLLEDIIRQIDKEKGELDIQYNELYNNEDLI